MSALEATARTAMDAATHTGVRNSGLEVAQFIAKALQGSTVGLGTKGNDVHTLFNLSNFFRCEDKIPGELGSNLYQKTFENNGVLVLFDNSGSYVSLSNADGHAARVFSALEKQGFKKGGLLADHERNAIGIDLKDKEQVNRLISALAQAAIGQTAINQAEAFAEQTASLLTTTEELTGTQHVLRQEQVSASQAFQTAARAIAGDSLQR